MRQDFAALGPVRMVASGTTLSFSFLKVDNHGAYDFLAAMDVVQAEIKLVLFEQVPAES